MYKISEFFSDKKYNLNVGDHHNKKIKKHGGG
jgi:hypothetical protein